MRSETRWIHTATVGAFLICAAIGIALAAENTIPAHNKNVAITIDDLPVIKPENHSPEEQVEIIRSVTAVFAKHHVPATGFVIGKNIKPFHRELLTEFVNQGNTISDHSFSHLNPNKVPIKEYIADIDRGQNAIREWSNGIKFYRFPFLFYGSTERDHDQIRQYLLKHGYVTAHVTIDNDDWSFNRDYVAALKVKDAAKAQALASDYLKHMKEQTRHFEIRAQEVAGRPVSHILLLHMSKINADHLDQLLGWYEEEGYQFISLAEALKDPIYTWRDRFLGQYGISWLDRIIEPAEMR